MGPKTVLTVDDDPPSRRLIGAILEKIGYRVIEAESGARALELLETARPAIVVADWIMPDVDGLELCRRIRQRSGPSYVYVIVLTSRSERSDVTQALEAGADDFIAKPLDAAQLRARLATAERILGLETALADRVRSLEETLVLLREREARLVEAERLAAVGQVVITVHHEINNPLAGILGFMDLLLADPSKLPPSAVDMLERVAALARRIRDVVAKLAAVRSSATKEYVAGERMLDIDAGRGPDAPPPGK